MLENTERLIEIYANLKMAQKNFLESNHLDKLFDLIQYNLELLEDYDDFTTLEKKQMLNFSKDAFKCSLIYNNLLDKSLI